MPKLSFMEYKSNPAEHLVNLTLGSGWKVIEKFHREKSSHYGCYSTSYIVEKDGKQAWLKAFDLHEAERVSVDNLIIIEQVIKSFNYERAILEECKGKKLKNVVQFIEADAIELQGFRHPDVYFIILEKGNKNVKDEMADLIRIDYAWCFRTLHQIANGINQLHTINIAHQDIKPSNVVSFNGKLKKITDLGSAHSQNQNPTSIPSKFEDPIVGTSLYAPPELLYGEVNHSWDIRRKACDMYNLGSLAVFLLIKRHMTPLIKTHLHYTLHWDRNHNFGNYRSVVEFVVQAFERALIEVSDEIEDIYLRQNIIPIIRQLCYPVPEVRGHPRSILELGSNYSLQRYVSIFDRIAKHYEYNLKS